MKLLYTTYSGTHVHGGEQSGCYAHCVTLDRRSLLVLAHSSTGVGTLKAPTPQGTACPHRGGSSSTMRSRAAQNASTSPGVVYTYTLTLNAMARTLTWNPNPPRAFAMVAGWAPLAERLDPSGTLRPTKWGACQGGAKKPSPLARSGGRKYVTGEKTAVRQTWFGLNQYPGLDCLRRREAPSMPWAYQGAGWVVSYPQSSR